ncbi:hypothetical protein C8F04DRAFT_1291676 [Mycena alexandri]|uniref:Uncharacterized protein n=1 Tax=Mycena alexandri TaxID=1745969 RepID=A0AAD6SL98_9AGAR|nr:hypothetical protein C8F04DRAFT_1291676 [Mycena alexandri]
MACRRCCRIAQGPALGRTRSELAHKQAAANVVFIPLSASPSLPCSLSSPSTRSAPNLTFVLTHTYLQHAYLDLPMLGPRTTRTWGTARLANRVRTPAHRLRTHYPPTSRRGVRYVRGVSAAWWERDLEGAYVPSALYLFFFNHVLFPSFVPISHPLLLHPRPRPRVHRRTPTPTPTALSRTCQVPFARTRTRTRRGCIGARGCRARRVPACGDGARLVPTQRTTESCAVRVMTRACADWASHLCALSPRSCIPCRALSSLPSTFRLRARILTPSRA